MHKQDIAPRMVLVSAGEFDHKELCADASLHSMEQFTKDRNHNNGQKGPRMTTLAC
jgi:hypothetical protein